MESSGSNKDGGQVRGLGWASNSGFGLAVIGLLLVLYSYYWAIAYDSNFTPMGMSGSKIGYFLFVVGAIVGVTFMFTPTKPAPLESHEGADVWKKQYSATLYMERASRMIALAGIAVMFIGLLLANWVYSLYVTNSGADSLNLGGFALGFNTWTGVFIVLAAVGGFLWAVFWVRADAYRTASYAYWACYKGASTMGSGAKAGHATSGDHMLPPNVSMDQVRTLMKRLDGMLATLPENQVGQFSKSVEAETYLVLLGQKK